MAAPPPVYGPPPEWARYKELGEPAVRAKLPNPDAYTIEWPNSYLQGPWRHKGNFTGYTTCGRLRTKEVSNRYPITLFVIVIDHDQVQTVDVSTRDQNSLVNFFCRTLISNGTMPPAPSADDPIELRVEALGLTIRPVKEGAYVVAVAPGQPGERAGLAPGMVMTHVNGIALEGLGSAMAGMLASDTPALSIEIVGLQRIDVKRQ